MKVTYRPPAFERSGQPAPPRLEQSQYVSALLNGQINGTFKHNAAPESYMFRELANPHSRAKKHERWLRWQIEKKKALATITARELQNLNGRSKKEAIAEAGWRWRQQMESEKEVQRKRRWKHKTAEAQMTRQTMRRDRKENKQRQRLTAMVLKTEPNQYIPKDM